MRENTTGLGKDCLLDWNLDETGCLTIYGSGSIPDFSCGKNPVPPWQEKKEQIRELYVSEGITEIGAKAFEGCRALKKVYLPDSLEWIHAYAFRDCCSLEEVQSKKNIFRYIYDENPGSARETVYFGLETFKNTPWAAKQWGDFYCEEGVLYICFSQEYNLVIPEGIHTLYEFSLANLGNRSVTLPETLTTIKELVFSGSKIEELVIPESVRKISPYAFADSDIKVVEFPQSMEKTTGFIRTGIMPACDIKKGKNEEKPCSIPDLYRVNMTGGKSYGTFRELKVMRKKEVHHKDGTVSLVYGRNHVAAGESLYRRIQAKKVLLCVSWKEEKLICIKSFIVVDTNQVCEYLMYPVLENGEINVWNASFSCQGKKDFVRAFPESDGKMLAEEGKLRMTDEGTQEEWFCSSDRNMFGGPLELEFLDYWKQKHPQIAIESLEEKGKHF